MLRREYTLSLNALFAPEADVRGALGAGASVAEAIVQAIILCRALKALPKRVLVRVRKVRPDGCR